MKGNILLVTGSANDLVGVAEQAAKKTGRELKMANSCPQTFEILSSGLDDVDLAMVDTAAGLHSLAILEALNYPAAPPVIALVEFDEAEATPILQRHGAAACLRKPFGADELATLIDTVCASARRNEALSCDKWGHVLVRGMGKVATRPNFDPQQLIVIRDVFPEASERSRNRRIKRERPVGMSVDRLDLH